MKYLEKVLPGLAGRTAIVTGAASGIGAAIARALAELEVRVVLVDRNSEGLGRMVDLINHEGGTCHSITVDLLSIIDANSAREKIVGPAMKAFGSLQILMLVAGNAHTPRPVEEITPEDLDYVFGVNARAAFFVSQAALPHLRPKGVILYVSSLTAEMGFPNTAGIAMSKGALRALTRAIAVDVAGSGVRVNLLTPGAVDTPLNEPYWTDEFRVALTARTPANRIAVAEDLVGPALFLVSDAARHIYGQNLIVDGGYSILGDAMPPGGRDANE